MTQDADRQLESFLPRFGLTAFRHGQKEVIAEVMAGRNCLCVMPTGGGKSLCYQLPAVALDGLTLVVSPLIALMKDQVDQLQSLGLPVSFINSTLSLSEQQERLDRVAAGEFRLVYVVPERFRSERFLEAVRAVGIKLLAVDEAHCISEWGHDFRPDYARLGFFRRMLGHPTTIALTATATDKVRRDIIEQLDLHEPKTFVTGFARENLFYEVQSPRGDGKKAETLQKFLRETPGSGIIYCSTRKRTEEVAEILKGEKRRVTVYHAGMLPEDRRQAQDDFMSGKSGIVTATNAFGMGIDKADVRFVVHYNMPGSLEAYYQEAGRAGRDGIPSRCLMLYSGSDRFIQEYFIESNYPGRHIVEAVYNHLCKIEEDPIQITQQDLKENLGLPIGADGVGNCEQLLEGAGVLERLVASQNMASVRIDSDLPTLVDLLPKQARVQRKVLKSVERLVGDRREELVPFQIHQLDANQELDHDSIANALRELCRLEAFTYIPPFRGRAIRMIRRDLPFSELEIDFEELERRKAIEFEKLGLVVSFAQSGECRQNVILRYFGEETDTPCGHCDNCRRQGRSTVSPLPLGEGQGVRASESTAEAKPLSGKLLETVRIILSGVARMQARFACGVNLIAQMLCGSKSAKMQQLHLDKLSTYGLLNNLQQTEVTQLIDALLSLGCLQQENLDRFRPVIKLTDFGTSVMKGTQQLSGQLPISRELHRKITGEKASLPSPPGRSGSEARSDLPSPYGRGVGGEGLAASDSIVPRENDAELTQALKKWRQEVADESGVPPYFILSKSTIEEIVENRPATSAELLEVKGFGPNKLTQFGHTLLEILHEHAGATAGLSSSAELPARPALLDKPAVAPASSLPSPFDGHHEVVGAGGEGSEEPIQHNKEFIDKTPFAPSPIEQPSPLADESPASQPSYHWTRRLLSTGYTPDECAAIRGISRQTVLAHVLQSLAVGLEIRPEWFLSKELLSHLQSLPPETVAGDLSLLLQRLPPDARREEVAIYQKLVQSAK
jgi:ATP-dependent DNA helicase RecQ